MLNSILRLLRDDRGAAAAEFALVAPFLLALGLGALIAGELLTVGHSVQQIANEAARYSIAAGASADDRLELVHAFLDDHTDGYPLIDAANLTADVADDGSEFHRITVRYQTDTLLVHMFEWLTPFATGTIERSAVVRAGGY